MWAVAVAAQLRMRRADVRAACAASKPAGQSPHNAVARAARLCASVHRVPTALTRFERGRSRPQGPDACRRGRRCCRGCPDYHGRRHRRRPRWGRTPCPPHSRLRGGGEGGGRLRGAADRECSRRVCGSECSVGCELRPCRATWTPACNTTMRSSRPTRLPSIRSAHLRDTGTDRPLSHRFE